jgi:hypothetical protein
VVAALVLVGGSVGLFLTCFERGSEPVYRGASAEARRNHYLAFERLLEQMGHRVTVIEGPEELEAALPSVWGTLLYPANRMTLGEERSERLLRWVASGGHLWVVTWTLWDDDARRPDFILDALDVRQYASQDALGALLNAVIDVDEEPEDDGLLEESVDPEDPFPGTDDDEAFPGLEPKFDLDPLKDPGAEFEVDPEIWNPDAYGDELPDMKDHLDEEEEEEASEIIAPPSMEDAWPTVGWDVASVELPDTERMLTAYFDRNFWLETGEGDPILSVHGEHGAHLMRMRHGRGVVTVSTDDYLLRNDGIGSADHAELALRFLRRGNDPAEVWLLPEENWPGLVELARTHGWAFFAALGIWLLAWLLRAGRRFGPGIPPAMPVRRSLLEHIDASGRMLAAGRKEVLLEAEREAIRETLTARRPAWLRLPHNELDQRLARSAGVSLEEVTRALRGDEASSGRTVFARAIATLERIRQTL